MRHSSLTTLLSSFAIFGALGASADYDLVLLQQRAEKLSAGDVRAAVSGGTAEMSEEGYAHVASLQNDDEMRAFVLRSLASEGQEPCATADATGKLNGLVPYYSGTTAVQDFGSLQAELRSADWLCQAPELLPPAATSVDELPSIASLDQPPSVSTIVNGASGRQALADAGRQAVAAQEHLFTTGSFAAPGPVPSALGEQSGAEVPELSVEAPVPTELADAAPSEDRAVLEGAPATQGVVEDAPVVAAPPLPATKRRSFADGALSPTLRVVQGATASAPTPAPQNFAAGALSPTVRVLEMGAR